MTPAIFTEVGERLTRALLTGDFELYRQVIDLPFRTEPRGGTPYTLETPEALEKDFRLYHQAVTIQKITDIYRMVEAIEPLGEHAWRVHCLMHIIEGARLAVEPFEMRACLRRAGDRWKIFRIESSLRHINWSLGQDPLAAGGGAGPGPQ